MKYLFRFASHVVISPQLQHLTDPVPTGPCLGIGLPREGQRQSSNASARPLLWMRCNYPGPVQRHISTYMPAMAGISAVQQLSTFLRGQGGLKRRSSAGKPKVEARINFAWLAGDGARYDAPNTRIIDFFQ